MTTGAAVRPGWPRRDRSPTPHPAHDTSLPRPSTLFTRTSPPPSRLAPSRRRPSRLAPSRPRASRPSRPRAWRPCARGPARPCARAPARLAPAPGHFGCFGHSGLPGALRPVSGLGLSGLASCAPRPVSPSAHRPRVRLRPCVACVTRALRVSAPRAVSCGSSWIARTCGPSRSGAADLGLGRRVAQMCCTGSCRRGVFHDRVQQVWATRRANPRSSAPDQEGRCGLHGVPLRCR